MAYSSQQGVAWKAGRLVTFQVYVQFSAWGAAPMTGALSLHGLPFPTAALPVYFAAEVPYSSNLSPDANDITSIFLYTGGLQTAWAFYGRRLGQNPRTINAADINAHTQFIISGQYLTDL